MDNKLENISINVAYDNLDESNLSNLNFQPQWLLDLKNETKKYLLWSQICLPNLSNTFNKNTLEYFYKSNSNFIYPIQLYTTELFYKHQTIDFDEKIIERVKQKKAKIVFFYITEGDWGTKQYHFDWVDTLVSKYNFQIDDLIFVTANLKASENYKGDKFTIIPFNFFLINLDFIPLNKSNRNDIRRFEKNYEKYIENNKSNKKINHILCFNGVPRLNRLLMFAELNLNTNLKNKFITSLKKTETENDKQFYYEVFGKTNNQNIIDFYQNYNSLESYVYDKKNWGKQIYWHASVNEDVHISTFVNLVTETLWNNESIFFSEKTYKPMYMCQPFIIFGNPHSLRKLKEYGFKTFDKWWDESYDDELDLDIRLEKITKVLEDIASWDMEKCYQITNEMEETLIHNFNKVLSRDEMINLYSMLQTDSKNIQQLNFL